MPIQIVNQAILFKERGVGPKVKVTWEYAPHTYDYLCDIKNVAAAVLQTFIFIISTQ